MSNIIPFAENALAIPSYMSQFNLAESEFLKGGNVTPPLISTNKGMFTAILDGEQQGNRQHTLDVVIVGESPSGRATGRIWYAGAYDPNTSAKSPDCFSNDGKTPDASAPNKQCSNCAECPQNVKGSGQKPGTVDCRFTKTLAVVVPAAGFDTVWQLRVSAQGIFAAADPAAGVYGLNALRSLLVQKRLTAELILTRLSFPEGSTGGIRFQPIGLLAEQDAKQSWAIARDPETVKNLLIQAGAVPTGAAPQAQPQQVAPTPVQAAPPAPVYTAPPAPVAPVYAAPPAPVYTAPPAPVYAPPVPQAPAYAPPPPPVAAPVYVQPVEQEHPQVMQQPVAAPVPSDNSVAKLNNRLNAAFN
jgi:hypothetical protein